MHHLDYRRYFGFSTFGSYSAVVDMNLFNTTDASVLEESPLPLHTLPSEYYRQWHPYLPKSLFLYDLRFSSRRRLASPLACSLQTVRLQKPGIIGVAFLNPILNEMMITGSAVRVCSATKGSVDDLSSTHGDVLHALTVFQISVKFPSSPAWRGPSSLHNKFLLQYNIMGDDDYFRLLPQKRLWNMWIWTET